MRLRGRLQERLLAYLLLRRNQVVPLDRLVEIVWGEAHPETALNQIRKMVSDLRKRLPPLKRLLTVAGTGYRLTLADDCLDLGLFETGTSLAREALRLGQRHQALDHLRSALALWRGPILDESGGQLLHAITAGLEERHVAALEQFFDIHLTLGRSDIVLNELREAVVRNPARETLRGQLMLALYRADRQSDALDEYHRLRQALDESHAIEPGPGIAMLYQRILRGDPDLNPAVAADRTATVVRSAPVNTLPYDLPDFTGREQALKVLRTVGSEGLTTSGLPGGDTLRAGAPRIVAIDGMGGSGKSALAIHAAHQLSAHYPDGQLYLDLQGFTPGARVIPAHEALAILLGSIGLTEEELPTNSHIRAARWRSVTSRRRLLLVLDNAVSAAQVRELLPHSNESLVIVTSRRRLPELDGAVAISPGMLSPAESIALLESVIGPGRVQAEIDEAHRIAVLCGSLPLALRICAARLQHRTYLSLKQLADRLAEQSRTIEELSSGDRSLSACLSTSYEALDVPYRTALTRLGSMPVPEFDSHTAAAVLGKSLMSTESVLEGLLDVHLLQQRAQGRYSFHDLVRAFALTSPSEEDKSDTNAALVRLLEHHVRVGDLACAHLFPGRAGHAEVVGDRLNKMPAIVDAQSALTWFATEQRGLLAALRAGAAAALYALTSRSARNLVFFLHMRGMAKWLQESAAIGLAAARSLNDESLVRMSLTNMGVALWRSGRFDAATLHLQEALALAETASDVPGQVGILNRLSACYERMGRYCEGERVLERSLLLLREHPAPQEEATARASLSVLYAIRGQFAGARSQAESALRLGTSVDTNTRINLLNALASALTGQGEPDAARRPLTDALELDRSIGGTQAGVHSLVLLAEAHLALGDTQKALENVEEALIRLDGGSRPSIHSCAALRTAAQVHLRLDDAEQAGAAYSSALEFAEATGYPLEIARAHDGLADVARVQGHHESSEQHAAVAMTILRDLGLTASPSPASSCLHA
ncbi:BTAD domain-containing putative transcriptional regulator [Streptomyces sp. NPDC002324]